jgi:hypothetical protein
MNRSDNDVLPEGFTTNGEPYKIMKLAMIANLIFFLYFYILKLLLTGYLLTSESSLRHFVFVARSQIPKPTPVGNQESIGLRMASNERKGNRQVYTTNLQKLL